MDAETRKMLGWMAFAADMNDRDEVRDAIRAALASAAKDQP